MEERITRPGIAIVWLLLDFILLIGTCLHRSGRACLVNRDYQVPRHWLAELDWKTGRRDEGISEHCLELDKDKCWKSGSLQVPEEAER